MNYVTLLNNKQKYPIKTIPTINPQQNTITTPKYNRLLDEHTATYMWCMRTQV